MDTATMSRLELMQVIFKAATEVLSKHGSSINDDIGEARELLTADGLHIRKTKLRGNVAPMQERQVMDIWQSHKKVFSVVWNSDVYLDLQLINLKRGPWIVSLLQRGAEGR